MHEISRTVSWAVDCDGRIGFSLQEVKLKESSISTQKSFISFFIHVTPRLEISISV